ncbi:uncharacterized protein LOC114725806 [Neltuma alba]|uniref:uncharacterized protein LOC114725806 n=1 Tax=Neltuma alba TaxID=207710 RepID=UPI0010A39C08|nr:uncharacterized protein LOC114725806 [Prosopis alba]XP_028768205.1 uncharacterized protein LOC114725806 [Prosopis alba]XP_028768206.1 uncharacterized protein LOC114725806 [Prosopis alba]
MGKKLDALFGRSFKATKFTPLVNLAIARLAVLKNQRQTRSKQALSDVLQLLQLGHHERALLRVEHVIKEQDMIDVYDKVEGYCSLLIERVHLIEQERECPEELKEAVAGLLYGASRCGEFPELQEIRAALTCRFGKEFTARAVELRNNCGVHPQMVQKLSTRKPSLERRLKALKEIAAQNSIVLQLEEVSSLSYEEQLNAKTQNQPEPETREKQDLNILPEGGNFGGLSDSFKAREKYKDVADAAQAAFESATYAASAARAAMEIYRSEPRDDDDPSNSTSPQQRKLLDGHDPERATTSQHEHKKILSENQGEESDKSAEKLGKQEDFPSSDSVDEILKENSVFVNEEVEVENESQEKELPVFAGMEVGTSSSHQFPNPVSGSKMQSTPQLDLHKRPFSVRTRHVRTY